MSIIINIPPEILNMICKTLSWRDIKNLEEVLPSDLFIQSGIKEDVYERTEQMFKNKMNLLALNSVNYDKEFEYHVSQYNFLIRNYQGRGIHSFHSLINSEYEQVVRYENLKSQNFKRAFKFENELRKFMKYCLKGSVEKMYTPAFTLEFPVLACSPYRRKLVSKLRLRHPNLRFTLGRSRTSNGLRLNP